MQNSIDLQNCDSSCDEWTDAARSVCWFLLDIVICQSYQSSPRKRTTNCSTVVAPKVCASAAIKPNRTLRLEKNEGNTPSQSRTGTFPCLIPQSPPLTPEPSPVPNLNGCLFMVGHVHVYVLSPALYNPSPSHFDLNGFFSHCKAHVHVQVLSPHP